MKKLAGLFTNNFGLKILAIVFAVVLWMVIVNVEDPDKAVSFSVEVEVVNADYLTQMGKTFEILDGTDTISFTVTGKRSIVETLDVSDFKAVANMENIDDSMSMVPIIITATSYSSQLEYTKRNSYLLVKVENLITAEYESEVVAEYDRLTKGCYVASPSVEPATVTVSGPKSVMEQIATAQVTLDVDGASEDVAATVEVMLLDEGGQEISQDLLQLSDTKVVATAEILMEKTVTLSFSVTGEPAAGYAYTGLECTRESITLIGVWDLLNAMDEWNISAESLSIDGAKETVTVEIALADVLPEGLALAEEDTETLTVSLLIEEEAEAEEGETTVSGVTNVLEE